MKDRIIEFLRAENKSSAQFAEDIGVQPSGISHILSGRNKPSLDFVLKMLEKYQFLSVDWLLFGKGTMYKDNRMHSLFDQDIHDVNKELLSKQSPENQELNETKINKTETGPAIIDDKKSQVSSAVKRIVWFYTDNSFEEFFPG